MTIRTLITILSLAAAGMLSAQESTAHVTYDYSDEIIVNPERGLFRHVDLMASQSNNLLYSTLKNYRTNGYSLVYVGFILDTFRDGRDISGDYLRRVRTTMSNLRQACMKGVIRFYYSADSNNKPWDVPLTTTLRHIEQLKPILEDNADVIALVEAGFVGTWGEWYQTENHTFNPQTAADYTARRAIVEALGDAVPQSRMIALRTPMYKMGVLGIKATDTLTAETAHGTSLQARLGFHNDCFLANADDAGTYGGVAANRTFSKRDSRYTVMGGETCSDPNTYTAVDNARRAFADYHWSYLNSDYHPGALGQWRQSDFYDEIRRNLGYRLTLLEGDYPLTAEAGTTLGGSFYIENVGWAAPFNPRAVELVLVGADHVRHTYSLDTDPRMWQPGYVHNIDFAFELPQDLAEGTYDLYLNLPAPEASIHDRPEYAIRTANMDTWDATLGMNRLTTIDITPFAGVSDPIAEEAIDGTTPIYDTMGRRVGTVATASTLSPGIYIFAGKKYKL